MSKIYTAAEVKAMEDEIDNDQQEVLTKPDLPADVVEFDTTLPLSVFTIEGEEVTVVSLKKVHAALNVKTSAKKWLGRMSDTYGFILGEDYVAINYDASTLEGRRLIQANGGHLTHDYLLTSDMAKELCMVDKTELGRRVRKYFLIAERIAKKFARTEFALALGKKEQDRLGEKRWADKMEAEAGALAKKYGFSSVAQAMNHTHREAEIEDAAEKAKVVSESGLQAKAMERVIERAAGYLKKVKGNPDKVQFVAEELLEAVTKIKGGDLMYCPAF